MAAGITAMKQELGQLIKAVAMNSQRIQQLLRSAKDEQCLLEKICRNQELEISDLLQDIEKLWPRLVYYYKTTTGRRDGTDIFVEHWIRLQDKLSARLDEMCHGKLDNAQAHVDALYNKKDQYEKLLLTMRTQLEMILSPLSSHVSFLVFANPLHSLPFTFCVF